MLKKNQTCSMRVMLRAQGTGRSPPGRGRGGSFKEGKPKALREMPLPKPLSQGRGA